MNTIQAAELRVGNLFRFISTDSIEQVADIRTAGIKTPTINNVLIDDCEHIPLTEDWLMKLGFICNDEDGERWQIESCPLFEVYQGMDNEFSHAWDASYTESPIEYVHQLQNLYFALTGTELTLTDK